MTFPTIIIIINLKKKKKVVHQVQSHSESLGIRTSTKEFQGRLKSARDRERQSKEKELPGEVKVRHWGLWQIPFSEMII